jgi:predicted nucleic acid-binding protein
MPAKLHAGEIEALLLARQRRAVLVVLDGSATRKTTTFLGLDLTGAWGF